MHGHDPGQGASRVVVGERRRTVENLALRGTREMRILLTGHDGYIGHVLTPMLLERGHEVTGLDSCLYEGCGFATGKRLSVPVIRKDVREVDLEDLRGFDAVAHLA